MMTTLRTLLEKELRRRSVARHAPLNLAVLFVRARVARRAARRLVVAWPRLGTAPRVP